MEKWKKRLSMMFVVAIALSVAMLFASCTPSDPTSGKDTTNGDPTGTGTVEPTIEEIALNFANGDAATAQIEGTKIVLVHTRSNYLLIEGSGYSLKLADGTEQKPDADGKLQIENTSDSYMSMKLEITATEKTTLTFTLIHNLGTDANPYIVPAGESMTIDYTEEVSFKVEAGWYRLTCEQAFTLTNYTLDEDGLVYLVAGTYGVSTEKKKVETSLTVTPVEAPAGYSAENPTDINTLGKNERKTYKNVTLYFRFTAPADGLYIFELGDEGRSANSRFAVSADGYKTYYGRYSEEGEWRYYDAGTTYAAKLNKGEQLTVAVDFTMGEYMVGEENVCLNVSAPTEIKNLDATVKTTLKQRGRAYFAFTAEIKGVYDFMLRGSGSVIENSLIAVFENGQEPTYVGYGENTSLRLEAGQTAYIVVKGKKNEAGDVGVAVQKSNDEPIPDGQWPSGFYANGKSFEFALYRDTKTMIYRSEEAEFTYLDGEITVSFGGTEYTFFINEEGKYAVKFDQIKYDFGEDTGWDEDGEYNEDEDDDGEIPTVVETVEYELTYTPFPAFSAQMKDFVGVYENAAGEKLYIFDESGDGVYGLKRYNGNVVSFNEKKNILQWETNGVSIEAIEMRDGRVYKIKVTAALEEVGEFILTDEEVTTPPEELPEEVRVKYYYGEGGYELGDELLNNATIYILKQIEGGYLISACEPGSGYNRMIMQMIISEDSETIRLLDSKGNVLSTLTTQGQSGGDSGSEENPIDKSHTGEYVSADGKLSLYWDGAQVSYNKGSTSLVLGKVTPTVSDGVYTFTYDKGAVTVTFRFTEDGNVSLNDSKLGQFTMTKVPGSGIETGGDSGDTDEPIERNEDGMPYLSATNKTGWAIEDGIYGDYNETYLCVKQTGWYTFRGDNNCELFIHLTSRDITNVFGDKQRNIKLADEEVTIYLEKDEMIAFINSNVLYAVYSETNPNEGKEEVGSESNPLVWDGKDLAMDDYRKKDTSLLYITFTATKSGSYQFNFVNSANDDPRGYLVYNGKTYGRTWDSVELAWVNANALPLTINLTEGQTITFAVANGQRGTTGWSLTCIMP